MWTRFMDLCSGGCSKEPHEYIYIEAPEELAKVIFFNHFGHDPERITYACNDYYIYTKDTLEEASAFDRRDFGDVRTAEVIPVEEYVLDFDVLIIYDKDIQSEERIGEVPEQGYVWRS